MANLIRVLNALYCDPWLLGGGTHKMLCEIAWAHQRGEAHGPGRMEALTAFAESEDRIYNKVEIVDGIAVVYVAGVIGRRFSSMLNHCGVTSVDVLEEIVRDAVENPRVRGIFLDVDSPGGHVTGVPECGQVIADATRSKPVASWTGGMMCSAAYWLSAGCDALFCSDSADVGSIGVYSAFLDSSRAYENEGYSVELFARGKYKGMGMPGTSLSEEQRELIQEGVDEVYEQFTTWVAGNRRVAEGMFEGQSVSGKAAVAAGLADAVKTRQQAFEWLAGEVTRRG